jgi:hypothetical protein
VNRTGRGYFRKGASGNPGGRPHGKIELRDVCRAHCVAAVEELARLALHAKSEGARLKAIELLLERAYGPPCKWADVGSAVFSDSEIAV